MQNSGRHSWSGQSWTAWLPPRLPLYETWLNSLTNTGTYNSSKETPRSRWHMLPIIVMKIRSSQGKRGVENLQISSKFYRIIIQVLIISPVERFPLLYFTLLNLLLTKVWESITTTWYAITCISNFLWLPDSTAQHSFRDWQSQSLLSPSSSCTVLE